MPVIVFAAGPLAGEDRAILDSGATIGRSDACDITIEDPQVSSRHADFRLEDGDWWIHDLDSSNGTMVNDRVTQAIRLFDSDRITIGDSQIVFRITGEELAAAKEATSEPTPVAPPAPAPLLADGARATSAAHVSPPTRPAPPIAAAMGSEQASPHEVEATEEDVRLVAEMADRTDAIRKEVGKVIVGQHEVLDQVLMCIIAGGHALLIGLARHGQDPDGQHHRPACST